MMGQLCYTVITCKIVPLKNPFVINIILTNISRHSFATSTHIWCFFLQFSTHIRATFNSLSIPDFHAPSCRSIQTYPHVSTVHSLLLPLTRYPPCLARRQPAPRSQSPGLLRNADCSPIPIRIACQLAVLMCLARLIWGDGF